MWQSDEHIAATISPDATGDVNPSGLWSGGNQVPEGIGGSWLGKQLAPLFPAVADTQCARNPGPENAPSVQTRNADDGSDNWYPGSQTNVSVCPEE